MAVSARALNKKENIEQQIKKCIKKKSASLGKSQKRPSIPSLTSQALSVISGSWDLLYQGAGSGQLSTGHGSLSAGNPGEIIAERG